MAGPHDRDIDPLRVKDYAMNQRSMSGAKLSSGKGERLSMDLAVLCRGG